MGYRICEMKFALNISCLFLLLWQSLVLSMDKQVVEKVSVQFPWIYQFEFAGFIAAKEKGYYRDAGLDVTLIEYRPGLDVIDEIMSRRSNYGVHNASLIIKDGGVVPIVLLATYLQQSPLVFVTKPEVKHPSDFIGRRIMGTTDELRYSSLALLLSLFDINETNARMMEHSFNINDFIDGRVDVMSVYRSNQLFELDERNIQYNIIDPDDYGFFSSADNLFASHGEVLQHPQRTQKFIDATNQGWMYALKHPQELIDIIYERYSKKKNKAALRYEFYVIKKMMLLDFYSIGKTSTELTSRTFKQLKKNKMLDQDVALKMFLLEDVLKENSNHHLWTVEEERYLRHKGEIKMCVDPSWLPFEAIKEGKYIGIAADIFDLFRELLPIPIVVLETKTWMESIDQAKRRGCDIFSLAAATPERETYMDFTQAYINLPIVMATKTDKYFIEDINQVKDRRIGIVKGYAIADFLKVSMPGINIVDVNSVTDGLAMVENDELYGYIDNLMVIASSIQKEFTGVLKISARLDEKVRLAVATRKDEPLLHDIFEKLVVHIEERDKQRIYNNWVSVKQDMAFDYTRFWQFAIVCLFIIGALLYHYYKLRKYSDMLKNLTITDALTGAYNRLKMDEILVEKQDSFVRYGMDCGVIMIDIDFFKKVNDSYGHQVGDAVLIEFSSLLKRSVRVTDIVCRWGGEEFLIICPNIGLLETRRVAQKLLKDIGSFSFIEVGELTASFGVGCLKKGLSIETIIEDVDVALYHSKQEGRNRVTLADYAEIGVDDNEK